MALASDPSAGSEKPWLTAISGASPRVLALLDSLHAQAAAEEPFVSADDPHDTAIDRFVGLEPDKCALVYLLLRATGAKHVVEAGTSFGLSTIYLALAVGQNASITSTSAPNNEAKRGEVIATELEPSKAARAREHWKLAGPEVEPYIELREGDLRQTLAQGLPDQIDFLLLDVWTPMALPALKLVQPHLRKGALIVADNTRAAKHGYVELMEYVAGHENNGFRTTCVPYSGGLQVIVYLGQEDTSPDSV